MDQKEIQDYPFNIMAIFEICNDWSEAEKTVRDHCKKRNISDEDCKKLLDRNTKFAEKPQEIRYFDDSVEPYMFEIEGMPMNIYEFLKRQNLSKEIAEEKLNQYCHQRGYSDLKKEKIFFEWKVWTMSDEEIKKMIKNLKHV